MKSVDLVAKDAETCPACTDVADLAAAVGSLVETVGKVGEIVSKMQAATVAATPEPEPEPEPAADTDPIEE